jgi:hypothetical protein
VIARIKVSTSRTQIVAGSKFLHHVLPDLVPPIDRRYTFRFFTGQRVWSRLPGWRSPSRTPCWWPGMPPGAPLRCCQDRSRVGEAALADLDQARPPR